MGPEQEEAISNINWIDNAKSFVEKLRLYKILLRDQVRNDHLLEEVAPSIDKYLSEQLDWGVKVKKYLFAEAQSSSAALFPRFAAKLATCQANAERKLITAFELAKSGYSICALSAISQIVDQNELSREDRLNACALVMENIATNEIIFTQEIHISERNQEWLCIANQSQEITEVVGLIIGLLQSHEKLDELSRKLKKMITLGEKTASTNAYNQEKIALNLAQKRNLLIKELSKSHQKPILRSIHHLACTGGTLISKCLASMHDVALISEVNPMNRGGSKFCPTNPLLLLERSYREFTKEEKIDIFKEQIMSAYRICQKDDVDLILRDHSHTDFHSGRKESEVCAIHDHLIDNYDLISIVSVRHPLESYLGLIAQGWDKLFYPSDLDEYSRRYLAFIERYSSLEVIRYEDFCDDPPGVMKKVCRILKISYNKDFLSEFGNYCLSGDSGRKGLEIIEKRPRKTIPKDLEQQLEKSEHYSKLVGCLGY